MIYARPEYFTTTDDFILTKEEWEQKRQKYYEYMYSVIPEDKRELSKWIIEKMYPLVRLDKRSDFRLRLDQIKEQNACHPHYFYRYFLYRVQSGGVPDQYVNDFLEAAKSGKRQDVSIAWSKLMSQTTGVRSQAIDNVMSRVDSFGRELASSMVVASAGYSNGYEWGKSIFEQSELDRATTLVWHIANAYNRTRYIQALIDLSILASASLYFAHHMLHFCRDRNNNYVISFWDFVNVERAQRLYNRRVAKELIGTGVELFDAYYGRWSSILANWTDQAAKATYVEQAMADDPYWIGRLLLTYRQTWNPEIPGYAAMWDGETPLWPQEVSKMVDIEHLKRVCDAAGWTAETEDVGRLLQQLRGWSPTTAATEIEGDRFSATLEGDEVVAESDEDDND